ncbi:sialidase family protein [Pseudomonas sp. SLFW]|uniref:WD40/YVTN/BNR-like repeat-containing protein n=1 Tax=Pseudomonas sp. SLFW TaxID=2683259 RepID=UPI0014133D1A|nr:sialidase family protein [Pseudomonas sp. SLFW]NBB11830.1 hypothetical protein [Pseudomonas sp. SLFW]
MAAIPTLTPLPSPALSTDPEDVFNSKTDATLLAQQTFVNVDMNTKVIPGINQAVTDATSAKNAAAQSASDAAGSASSANTSKLAAAQSATDATNNGAAQVALAAQQVTLANQARADAQSAAQAAGAAAGLPGGRVPFTVLQINAAGNVAWTDGLIDKTNALPGQALMLGTGKTPQWVFPGQQIGDVLQTCRDPGSLYLPANGSIRLQSAYPALFAKLGLIGGAIGTAWADYDFGGVTGIFAGAPNGTIIVWQSQTQVRRSTDRGQTWANVTTPSLGNNAGDIKTDGAGTWIIMSNITASPFQCLRSTDDGQTWQVVSLPPPNGGAGAGANWSKLLYCGNGVWLCTANYGSYMMRSVNGGASWSTFVHSYPQSSPPQTLAANGSGTVLISGYDGTNYTVRKSTDYGATFAGFMTLSGISTCIATDGQGTWIISLGGINALRSFEDATTAAGFTAFTVTGGVATSPDIIFVNGLVLFMFAGSGVKVIVMNPNGSFSSQSSAANVLTRFANVGNGIIFAGSTTANRLSRSVPQFGYDTSSLFALPNVPAAVGLNAYIKAKELA